MARRSKPRPETYDEPATPAPPLADEGPPPAPPSGVTRFQKFVKVRVHRSALKNAPYNPRTLSDKARAALKKNISKVGLLGGIIWNRATGNLLSGHQRISVLDSLEGTHDYHLDVDQVELDPRTEKEQNIFLNNGEAQGDFDYARLEKLYKDDKLDFENTGFSTADIYQLFGDSPLVAQPEALAAAAERVRAAKAQYDKSVEASESSDDPNFYVVAVFQYHKDREAFLKALGLEDNRFVDGRFLTAKLGALPGPGA